MHFRSWWVLPDICYLFALERTIYLSIYPWSTIQNFIWLTKSLPHFSSPLLLVSWWKEFLERAVDCSKEKECCTNLVRIFLHQLPHFVGTAVCCLNDQPAGIVLVCRLRQQLLQHRDDSTWTQHSQIERRREREVKTIVKRERQQK